MFPALTDLQLLIVSGASATSVISGLACSATLHRQRLKRLPIRIHIAGTRGKTTVTRLIWGGLRGGGISAAGKTTGTVPVLLRPDGSEAAWPRRGPASIAEQWRFVRAAVELDAQAIVVECMAVAPEFLWASERYAVRANVAVLTNLRPDHAEAMPTQPSSMAAAFRAIVPHRGTLVLTQGAAVEPILAAAHSRHTRVEIVGDQDGSSPDEINRRLALAVCRELGIPDEQAARGMSRAGCDVGALQVRELELEGCRLRLVSAFACNDPVSLELLWKHNHDPAIDRVLVIVNAREDRPDRTMALLRMLRSLGRPLQLFFFRRGFARSARAEGFADAQIRILASNDPQAVLLELARIGRPRAELWGVGNFQGFGAAMARHLDRRQPAC
jgi:poly-gamma-glutamate synthase PgsB/CapB